MPQLTSDGTPALASVGIFKESEPRSFRLTPMAELLRAEAPGFLREMVRHLCGDEYWRTWGHLGYSMRTGRPACGTGATSSAGTCSTGCPRGSDAYLLSRVVHDWDDWHSVAILRKCRRAMRPDGRLLLVEKVITPGDLPSYGKLSDLNMLVSPGGRKRTEYEYRALYEATGFALARAIPTRSRIGLLEGAPV